MTRYELKISLNSDMLKEIERYKKFTHKQSIEDAVTELINYALSLPLYFKEFDWEKAEYEADKEISIGKTKSFDTVEDLISDIKE